jgi:hypothetical protein
MVRCLSGHGYCTACEGGLTADRGGVCVCINVGREGGSKLN